MNKQEAVGFHSAGTDLLCRAVETSTVTGTVLEGVKGTGALHIATNRRHLKAFRGLGTRRGLC